MIRINARTARLALKLIVALPALIDLGRRGAAAGRAFIDTVRRHEKRR